MMRYCTKCGQSLPDNANFCSSCGNPVATQIINKSYDQTIQNPSKPVVSNGWGFLGFFLPLIGFIAYLFLMTDEPEKAKRVGSWALIGSAIQIIFLIGFLDTILIG